MLHSLAKNEEGKKPVITDEKMQELIKLRNDALNAIKKLKAFKLKD